MSSEYSKYIYGTEALEEPLRIRKHHRRIFARDINEAVRRNRKDARRMDLPFLMLLMAASVIALFICCNYIQVQSSINTSMKTIEAQEKTLETLKGENDALETRINASISLDHVYDVATKELGMVYARGSQVVRYEKTPDEYVRQYEDIVR